MDDIPRMDPGELQTIREYLGLSGDHLAAILGVNPRTLRAWEGSRDLIPERVRLEIEDLEEYTARAVDELAKALADAPDPAVRVYWSDAAMHRADPRTAHLPTRWWRHVVARACERVPGVEIVSGLGDWEKISDTEYTAEGEDGTYRLTLGRYGWRVISPGLHDGDDHTLEAAKASAERVHRINATKSSRRQLDTEDAARIRAAKAARRNETRALD